MDFTQAHINNKTFPDDCEARRSIIEIGKRMYAKNFVASNNGNISCRVAEGAAWVTPAGVSKGYMEENELVKLQLDGTVISAGELQPTSEIKMHLRAYIENPDIRAVIHAHPLVSTSFAIAGIALDKPIYPEALINLGVVPCVRFEMVGSQELADAIAPYCKGYRALLLVNHGTLTFGESLMEAFFRLESLESYATVSMYTSYIIGKANTLSREQVDELQEIREKLDQK